MVEAQKAQVDVYIHVYTCYTVHVHVCEGWASNLVAERGTLIFGATWITVADESHLVYNVHVIKLDGYTGWVVVGRGGQREETVRHTRPVVSLLWHNIQQVVGARQQLGTTLFEHVEILT